MKIDPSKKFHLIGICGDGMSALARILNEMGSTVVGSDIQHGERVEELRNMGIEVYVGHQRSNLSRDTDLVIVSSAIDGENPEIEEAKELNIPIHQRLTALADLMERKKAIGIAGTHGKSTTTTMAASLLQFANCDPTYMIGAECDKLGGNSRLGQGDHFLAEVDESDGHFLELSPDVSVVTNVGRDHLDTYKNEAEILEGFIEFVKQSNQSIICRDDDHSQQLIDAASDSFTFGIDNPADLEANSIVQRGFETSFDLCFQGHSLGRATLPAPGRHNVYNALAAMAVGYKAGLGFSEMMDLLSEIELPQRRFQVIKNNGSVVIDDYAHLPEEIEVTLEAVKNGWNPDRVVAIFQPHRFSRTKHINGQFGSSFELADLVVVTEIYPAFERPIPGITSQLIFQSIENHNGSRVQRILDRDEVLHFLQRNVKQGDFLVGLGAGDVWKLTHQFSKLPVATR
ncbi:MAG: UDP-N-acetylmuramate--L-alanine ligase [Candidatus Bipolaricaulota bacterium]